MGILYTDVSQIISMALSFLIFFTPVVYTPANTGLLAVLTKVNPVSSLIVTTREWFAIGDPTQLLPACIVFARHARSALRRLGNLSPCNADSRRTHGWVREPVLQASRNSSAKHVRYPNQSRKPIEEVLRSLKKSLWYGMQDMGNELRGRLHGGNGELRAGEFWAVKDVSFELKRGECLGLIGRNGAGKTTLLRMLNGLIKPDQGPYRDAGARGCIDCPWCRVQPHPVWAREHLCKCVGARHIEKKIRSEARRYNPVR